MYPTSTFYISHSASLTVSLIVIIINILVWKTTMYSFTHMLSFRVAGQSKFTGWSLPNLAWPKFPERSWSLLSECTRHNQKHIHCERRYFVKNVIGNVNIGIIFLFIGNSQWCLQCSVNSDWLFNTQSRILQAYQLILEIEHKHALFLSFSDGIQVSLTRCSYKVSPLVICQKAKPIQIENWTM